MTKHSVKTQPDDLDAEFYSATALAKRLCIQRCTQCGQHTHPARYFCPACSSGDYTFEPVNGAATVHSYTVSHMSVDPAWKDLVPYLAIVCELAEGPRVIARTATLDAANITIGMAVRLETEVVSPEFSYVWAHPAETAR